MTWGCVTFIYFLCLITFQRSRVILASTIVHVKGGSWKNSSWKNILVYSMLNWLVEILCSLLIYLKLTNKNSGKNKNFIYKLSIFPTFFFGFYFVLGKSSKKNVDT